MSGHGGSHHDCYPNSRVWEKDPGFRSQSNDKPFRLRPQGGKAMAFDPLAPPPLLTGDLPGIGGRIKQLPEDFEVEEIPAYEPSGQGEYLYLWLEKRAMGAEFF